MHWVRTIIYGKGDTDPYIDLFTVNEFSGSGIRVCRITLMHGAKNIIVD